MGLDTTSYVILGYKLDHVPDNWDEMPFVSMVEGQRGEPFTLVIDQMLGKYSVFGICLSKINESEEGFNVIESHFIVGATMVKERYNELFGPMEDSPTIIHFNHVY